VNCALKLLDAWMFTESMFYRKRAWPLFPFLKSFYVMESLIYASDLQPSWFSEKASF